MNIYAFSPEMLKRHFKKNDFENLCRWMKKCRISPLNLQGEKFYYGDVQMFCTLFSTEENHLEVPPIWR